MLYVHAYAGPELLLPYAARLNLVDVWLWTHTKLGHDDTREDTRSDIGRKSWARICPARS
jgi:hypothetical protein